MILRARMIWPVARPPVEDGVVCLQGDRITWVGRHAELPASQRGEMLDLGETLLLPGLINAHCHLDYTGMAGQLLPPRRFTDWIKGMVALKSTWSTEDFSKSWQQGAQMLLRTGTTTVGTSRRCRNFSRGSGSPPRCGCFPTAS